MSVMGQTTKLPADAVIQRYYRWHAPIYDATRWTFLFGRNALLRRLADSPPPGRILEVGCGTGRNLAWLARRFPTAELLGLDVSPDMLARAGRRLTCWGGRVQCVCARLEVAAPETNPCDLILFSYSLSMMNPGWETALQTARACLSDRGRIGVVDFGNTRWSGFRRWMARNHVRLDGHLLPALRAAFQPLWVEERAAYGGLWTYFLFIGRPTLA